MLKLHFAPGTCSLASLIALNEANADFETVHVSFNKEEQKSQAYLQINPKARVPSLDIDGQILTETPAILFYLAEQYANSPIALPTDPLVRGQINAFNSYLCSTVHVSHAHRMRGYRWANDPVAIEAMKRKVPESVMEGFMLIENEMLAGPWVLGKDYSICDPYLFTLANWLEGDGVDVNQLPRVAEHRQRMQGREAVKRAMQIEQAA